MRSAKPLLHGEITSSIIDSFFDVHAELGFGFREYLYARALERLLIEKGTKSTEKSRSWSTGQLSAGLAATNLEVGLVLHFGKKVRFYRVFFENRFKHRNKP